MTVRYFISLPGEVSIEWMELFRREWQKAADDKAQRAVILSHGATVTESPPPRPSRETVRLRRAQRSAGPMSNRRARYMGSRQYPPLPVEKPHLICRCHFNGGGRCWVRCQCGALMYAKSPDALSTRWRDHRAASGLRTPALSEAVG